MKLIYLIAITVAVSCVKKRPVEKFQDFDGNRWEKSVFQEDKNWLYRVIVTNTGLNSEFGFVGMQSDSQLGYFEFTQGELRFLAPKTDFTDASNPNKLINSWSITHTDIHRKEVDGRKSNVETENNEIPWDQKTQFKVDWDVAEIKESFAFFQDDICWSPVNRKLVDDSQEVSSDHISFTIAVDYLINPRCIGNKEYYNKDYTITNHYKYSFMPDPGKGDYQPYVYSGEDDPLMDKYGYFNTTFVGYDAKNKTKNQFFMNRWDPNKTHTIYFAPGFPEKYKWIYNDAEIGIMAQTNKVFADAGLKIRFEIKEAPPEVKFGDIRYSFVQFIEEPDQSAPFGYGPMTAHPFTGEIISANSIMWTSGLEYYLDRIRDYQARQPNRSTESSIYRKMAEVMGQEAANWTTSSSFLNTIENGEAYRYLLPEYTYELPGTGFARRETELKFDSMERAAALLGDQAPEFDSALSRSKAVWADTTRFNVDRDHFNNPMLSTRYDLNERMFAGILDQDIDPQQAINDILYRVAIHEFGHNLNLRHNFYGSVGAGIDQHQEAGTKRTSNSVMDYLTLQDELGQVYDWEPYDKAALLYAYSDGAVDPAASRQAPYLFCTDHHTIFNPLCNRFDRGSTISEVVMATIESYDNAYWLRNFRQDRAYWNTNGYPYGVYATMFNLLKALRFYDQAFDEGSLPQILSNYGFDPDAQSILGSDLRNDALQAVKLVISFYTSVIQQSSSDRSFSNSYETSTGALSQLGISDDKIFAASALFGEDAFPLDPNRGTTVFSFHSIAERNPELGEFALSNLSQIFVEGGDMYVGYESFIRTLYGLSAQSRFELTGDLAAMQRMQTNCYSLNTFQDRFGLSADTLGNTPQEIAITGIAEYPGEVSLGVQRIGDFVYAASPGINDLAHQVLSSNSPSNVVDLSSLYQQLAFNRLTPTCE